MYYREALNLRGEALVPLPGGGSADTITNNAAAVLQDNADSTILPDQPIQPIIPSQNSGTAITAPMPVANAVLVDPAAGGLGAGIMTWIKANPLPAIGIGLAAVYLINELSKKGAK